MDYPTKRIKQPLLWFFLITFGFSWFFWSIDILNSLKVIELPFSYMLFFAIGANGPLVGALVMSGLIGGWREVKRLIRSGFNLRMRFIWWFLIFLIPAVISALALWVNFSLNGFQFDNTLLVQPLLIIPNFLVMFFIGGSVQEEFGWRGFALPRLLKTWNPLVASLLLGFIWGIWHLPLFFIEGTGQYYMPLGIFLLMTFAFSVLFTWFYLHTGENLFSALLFHTTLNTFLGVFPPIQKIVGGNQLGMTYIMIAYGIVALVVVFLDQRLFLVKLPVEQALSEAD
jgi:membrane protease YdiL (CAAX protease family)